MYMQSYIYYSTLIFLYINIVFLLYIVLTVLSLQTF